MSAGDKSINEASSASENGASNGEQANRAKRKPNKGKGKRGPRGKTGPAGPAGPPGPTGAPGVGLNFNRALGSNSSSAISRGNFTITAASDANGNCVNIKLRANAKDSRLSVGPGGGFVFLPNNTDASVQGGDTSQMFTAVTDDGTSTMSGIIGRVSVGGRCYVSGYVTGV